MTSSADPRFASCYSPDNTRYIAGLRFRAHDDRVQLDRDDYSTVKRWRLWVFLFYAAVSTLLVGLAVADQPGSATVASAQLGQNTAMIGAGRPSR
jgi:hypothetical protein